MPDTTINEKSIKELITVVYDQNKMMVTLQNKINSLEKEIKNNTKKYYTILAAYSELTNVQNNEMVKYNEFVTYLKTQFPKMFSEIPSGESSHDNDNLSSVYIAPDGNIMKSISNVHILDIAKHIISTLKIGDDNVDNDE